MDELVRITDPGELAAAGSVPGAPAFDPANLTRHAPQETWIVRGLDRGVTARGSIWWIDTPTLPGHRSGLVGHYAATDAASGVRLLGQLCRRLEAAGCTLAVGPIDGNTWRSYRLVIDRGQAPPFLLEPNHPEDWPDHFRESGFVILAEYVSSVIEDPSVRDPRVGPVEARLRRHGVRIRTMDLSRADAELRAIHGLSLAAFRSAFLYTPIAEADFLDLYRPILPKVDPRYVFLAEKEGRLAGFLFAIPDLAEPARGGPLRTVIVKTLAVAPGRQHAGLGTLLLDRLHRAARESGLRRVIHALMHVENTSTALSRHWQTRTFRRYALFSRELSP